MGTALPAFHHSAWHSGAQGLPGEGPALERISGALLKSGLVARLPTPAPTARTSARRAEALQPLVLAALIMHLRMVCLLAEQTQKERSGARKQGKKEGGWSPWPVELAVSLLRAAALVQGCRPSASHQHLLCILVRVHFTFLFWSMVLYAYTNRAYGQSHTSRYETVCILRVIMHTA